jgi:hypothetical protein
MYKDVDFLVWRMVGCIVGHVLTSWATVSFTSGTLFRGISEIACIFSATLGSLILLVSIPCPWGQRCNCVCSGQWKFAIVTSVSFLMLFVCPWVRYCRVVQKDRTLPGRHSEQLVVWTATTIDTVEVMFTLRTKVQLISVAFSVIVTVPCYRINSSYRNSAVDRENWVSLSKWTEIWSLAAPHLPTWRGK